ncbi:hypothetical protein PLESTB_001174600 [Pleodorina starrii]|uniref:Uncharacterized protein n=1 Tax=Pleodorina starrii TaxID=330485 RepID=A0A9W6BS98_9CHLO|nr:hypothetical protein PLESTB_001174600 [Pleodorina starrii]
MSQLVKVTPSMNAERSAAVMGAAVSSQCTKKSSQGIELMDDEVEEFSCEYKATGRVTDGFVTRLIKKIKYYMTCQCLCECYIPTQSWSVQILVTSKRIVMREKMQCNEPGIKKCCYYVSGMCCCPNNVDSGYEEQFCIERKDIKDYVFNIKHKNSELFCMCCLINKKQEEAFRTEMFLSRPIVDTRLGWMGWSIDKDTKTFVATKIIDGMMSKSDSALLRQKLHEIVAQNAASTTSPSTEKVNLTL